MGIIERALPYQLRAKATYVVAEDGIRCTLRCLVQIETGCARNHMSKDALAGRRVLVVEDEYFLADDLNCALEACGAVVLGPVASVEHALKTLNIDGAPEIAVLDVNLDGEMSLPVADELFAHGIPFLFTTAYEKSMIPERHASVLRLEKPIEPSAILQALGRLLNEVI